MTMNWIYALFISELFLLAFAYVLSRRDILAPSVVMCTMFVLSTMVAILETEVELQLGMESFVILFVGILTFVLAQAVFQMIFQRHITKEVKKNRLQIMRTQPFLVAEIDGWVIVLGIAVQIFTNIWYYREVLRVAGSIGGAMHALSLKTTVISWEDTLFSPVLTFFLKISEAMGYIAGYVVIQRILARYKGTLKTIGLFSLVILSQTPAFLGGSRTGILRYLVALLVDYYIIWHQKNGWHLSLTGKYVRVGILCVVIGAPLFYYSLYWIGRKPSASLEHQIAVYLGYPIYLFDLYVKQPIKPKPICFGEESLPGIHSFMSKYLRIDTYVRNVNLEYRQVDNVNLGNVYTFFRRPLHDFGFIGMLIFTVLVALFFSWIYYGKIQWKRRTVSTDCWSIVYGYLFYWIVVSSIMQYSELCISFATLTMIIALVLGYRLMTSVRIKNRQRPTGKLQVSVPMSTCCEER